MNNGPVAVFCAGPFQLENTVILFGGVHYGTSILEPISQIFNKFLEGGESGDEATRHQGGNW